MVYAMVLSCGFGLCYHILLVNCCGFNLLVNSSGFILWFWSMLRYLVGQLLWFYPVVLVNVTLSLQKKKKEIVLPYLFVLLTIICCIYF